MFRSERGCRRAPSRNTIIGLVTRFNKNWVYSQTFLPPTAVSVTPAGCEESTPCAARWCTGFYLCSQNGSPKPCAAYFRAPLLHQELGLYPYRTQWAQRLRPGDKARRWEFSCWFVQQCTADPQFVSSLFMSDEAKPHLNRTVCKHNCRV